MKKYIKYIICVAVILTACTNERLAKNSCNLEENPYTDTVSITENLPQTTTVQITSLEQWAHNFAQGVYAELENNKTADDPTTFAPISNNHEVTAFDSDAMCADIFLLDVNGDDIPELFVGGHGTMGNGRYSIYDADGNCFGNDKFIWEVESFETDGQYLYAPSGSNSLFGHTKLIQGLPKIYANGFAFMNGIPTDAAIETAGSKIVVTIDSQRDFEDLYSQYLDTDYDNLKTIDMNKYICIRDYLRVPDPENYTEEDIYNCLLDLLMEYEEMNSSEASNDTADNALLSAKLSELDGTLLASFNYGNGKDDILAAIAYGTAPSVDIWRFTDNTEESVMPFCGMLSDVYGIHSESGVNSLVICNYAQGLANPATILSVIDGEVVVFSEYKGDTASADLLWYCDKNGADLICRKGNGISMGSYNIIPYYLDVSDNKYKPYGLTEISVDEAKALDKNGVITDIDKAVSAYRCDNGLVHINYDNVTEADFGEEHIASRTFVAENGCLRPYEDGDLKYGFFLQALTVTE